MDRFQLGMDISWDSLVSCISIILFLSFSWEDVLDSLSAISHLPCCRLIDEALSRALVCISHSLGSERFMHDLAGFLLYSVCFKAQ